MIKSITAFLSRRSMIRSLERCQSCGKEPGLDLAAVIADILTHGDYSRACAERQRLNDIVEPQMWSVERDLSRLRTDIQNASRRT